MAVRFSTILCNLLIAVFLIACSGAEIPTSYIKVNRYPEIYPDYVNVTIPCNIAPLNFISRGSERCVARLTIGNQTYVYGDDNKVVIDIDEWKTILANSRSKSIKVEVFLEKDGKWQAFLPFFWRVSADSIDGFVTYRLIHPSYDMYDEMSIVQRDVSSFSEKVIYTNKTEGNGDVDHCVNCHAFQNYNPDRFQFHIREKHNGTLVYDGKSLKKVNLKTNSNPIGAAYPAWHPAGNYIVYSGNRTMQHYHTAYQGKIEVQDTKSDLVFYDVDHDVVYPITQTPFELEVFPSWSPDGRWLYYSMAHVGDTTRNYIVQNYKSIRYDVYRRSFSPSDKTFGTPELVLCASSDSMSAVLPRISPDGRWMLTSQAPYGVFHIWHPESDLYLTNLSNHRTFPLTKANSSRSDSYHNWSSSSRWIVFTSRRMDGNYTHLYFAHIDSKGNVGKAFEMPWENPEECVSSLWSFNVPEFTMRPVTIEQKSIREIINN